MTRLKVQPATGVNAINLQATKAADRRPTLLTVDDEANICKALKRALRKLPVNVITAASGKEGLALLEAEPIDIVFSDMLMPEMTGAEFLAQVATLYPATKRVLLTGYSDIESTVRAINEGKISTYLSKPWDDTRLIEVAQDLIEQIDARRERDHLRALTQQQAEHLKTLNGELEARVERRTLALNQSHSQLEAAVKELADGHNAMVDLIASIVELRDPEGCADLDQKRALALAVAEEAGLDAEAVDALRHATLLHRLGRVGLADHLLEIPSRLLRDEKRAEFEQHPVLAEALLMRMPKLAHAARIIRNQHERHGGEGYPDGRVGDGIPLESQILALARDYHDLLAGRLEARALTPAEAIGFIRDAAGERYAPSLIEHFEVALQRVDDTDIELLEIRMDPRMLTPGMRLSRPLLTPAGVLVLNKDLVLTDAVIGKIINLSESVRGDLNIYIHKD
ncbi:MAG: HD domain-containing phosphohydrolase [Pseudomonadota bacterium]